MNCFPISSENDDEENIDEKEYGFHCFDDDHVIHIFSYSKGYAMAGFRVGYVVVNGSGDTGKEAYQQMLKRLGTKLSSAAAPSSRSRRGQDWEAAAGSGHK